MLDILQRRTCFVIASNWGLANSMRILSILHERSWRSFIHFSVSCLTPRLATICFWISFHCFPFSFVSLNFIDYRYGHKTLERVVKSLNATARATFGFKNSPAIKLQICRRANIFKSTSSIIIFLSLVSRRVHCRVWVRGRMEKENHYSAPLFIDRWTSSDDDDDDLSAVCLFRQLSPNQCFLVCCFDRPTARHELCFLDFQAENWIKKLSVLCKFAWNMQHGEAFVVCFSDVNPTRVFRFCLFSQSRNEQKKM